MKRVLIVEDDKELCSELCDELKGEGFFCECADTVRSAMEKIKRNKFDLIVCDIRVPSVKKEGIQLIRKIRQLERSGQIDYVGVIVITAWGDKENAIEALKLGAFDYLEKDPDRRKFPFKATVKRYFKQKAGEDQLIKALEGWIRRHPNPKEKLFFSGELSFSAKEIVDEIKKGSSQGKKFRDAIMDLTLDIISKAKK